MKRREPTKPKRPKGPARGVRKPVQQHQRPARQPPPDHTLQEAQYLKSLVANKTRVRVKLRDDQQVDGVVEYYDSSFIRLTREDDANLFLYKSEIKYLEELP